MRWAALVLALLAAIAAACDSTSSGDTAALDPGPTFGIEVTLAVSGNGRVVSDPAGIDCPANCFTRLTSAEREFDGSDIGFTLNATPGVGAHFVGWSAKPLVSGLRARGPADCSPMTRNAIGPPIGPIDQTVILPYGETQGTPPKGHEAECADYLTVPVAYSLIATFEDDPATSFFGQDAAPPGEVLFEPPVLGRVVMREIGLRGDNLYVRYDQDGLQSAIAVGLKSGAGGLTNAIAPTPNVIYDTVSIGPNIVAETTNEQLIALNLSTQRQFTQSIGNRCTGIASDDTTAYLRCPDGFGDNYFYVWPLDGRSYQFTYQLPNGNDLAVDDASIYYTGFPSNGSFGASTLQKAPKLFDAAAGFLPDASKLVPGLSAPRNLLVTASDLFWLDDTQDKTNTFVGTAPVTGTDAATQQFLPGVGTALAVDPNDPKTYYAAAGHQINRYTTDGLIDTYLTNLESVNGIAVDDTYVYWTENDGRVYRAKK